MKTNNRATLTAILLFISVCLGLPGHSTAAKTVQIDILYMNHGPMRPTVAKIKEILKPYGNSVQAAWHDVDQSSGKAFMKKEKITGHIPMLIRIDGQSDFSIDGRDIALQGFPTGASPFKRVEGNWSLDDLQLLLDQKIKR